MRQTFALTNFKRSALGCTDAGCIKESSVDGARRGLQNKRRSAIAAFLQQFNSSNIHENHRVDDKVGWARYFARSGLYSKYITSKGQQTEHVSTVVSNSASSDAVVKESWVKLKRRPPAFASLGERAW